MNTTQRRILKGALIGVVVTLLFPPFLFGWPNGGYAGMGYGFILSWPMKSDHMASVHVGLLLVEWLGIAIVSCILWALARDPKAPNIIAHLTQAMNRNVDATVEAARINADASIRAAEIKAPRPLQMDLLDHYR
jgi:hypothetical protein